MHHRRRRHATPTFQRNRPARTPVTTDPPAPRQERNLRSAPCQAPAGCRTGNVHTPECSVQHGRRAAPGTFDIPTQGPVRKYPGQVPGIPRGGIPPAGNCPLAHSACPRLHRLRQAYYPFQGTQQMMHQSKKPVVAGTIIRCCPCWHEPRPMVRHGQDHSPRSRGCWPGREGER